MGFASNFKRRTLPRPRRQINLAFFQQGNFLADDQGVTGGI
jgi:hypothetical protein